MHKLVTVFIMAALAMSVLACSHAASIASVRAGVRPSHTQVIHPLPVEAVFTVEQTSPPADEPERRGLPAGHPPIAGMAPATLESSAELPPGHPPIGQMPMDLPAGHPPLSPTQANSGLPANHPEISAQGGALTRMPPTAAGTGALIVRAVQGTAEGPTIADAPVTIALYHRGQVMARFTGTLDDQGATTFADLPLGMPFQPLVTIHHAGVEYQAAGEVMDHQHPGQEIEMYVYETTEQRPDWRILMRHIMVQPTVEGLHVAEMLSIENPADRSWIGPADDKGHRKTLLLPLPPGAIKARAANGEHDCCAVPVDGMLADSMPLLPGVTQFQFEYFVPIADAAVDVTIQAPTDVQHTMLFVPDDGTTVRTTGLAAIGASPMVEAATRAYRAAPMKAGEAVSFSITGLTDDLLKAVTPAEPADPDAPVAPRAAGMVTGAADMPRMIAGIGAAVILVLGLTAIFLKPRRSRA